MSEFKKCPEGHVYDSGQNECPYCNGRKIEDDLEDLPETKVGLPDNIAMCYDMGPRDIDWDSPDDNDKW